MIALVLAGFAGLGLVRADVAVAGAVLSSIAPLVRRWTSSWPWAPVTVLLGVGLVVASARGTSAEDAVAFGLAWLQVHRRLVRADAADDRVSVLLSLLMLALAAVTSTSPVFLAIAVVVAVLGPPALLRSFLADELPSGRAEVATRAARTTGVVAGIAVLALSAVAFVALPRPSSPPVDEPTSMVASTGFDDHVQLGDLDALVDDEAVVATVSGKGLGADAGPIYLRGVVLDRFDGRAWTSTMHEAAGALPKPSPEDADGALTISVRREPLAEGALFTTGDVLSLVADQGPVERDRDGWFLGGDARVVRYAMVVRPPFGPSVGTSADGRTSDGGASTGSSSGETSDPRYTDVSTLPVHLRERLAETAKTWTAGVGDREDAVALADAIRGHLLAEYAYTRAPRDAKTEAPLETFLYERKTGHCEYFAAALAVLLRIEGVPTRLVDGLAGGEWNEFGGYWVFRRAHAHAWVEVGTGHGWALVDATPGPMGPPVAQPLTVRLEDALRRGWYDDVLGYDLGAQEALVVGTGRRLARITGGSDAAAPWLGALAIGALVGVAVALGVGGLRWLGARIAGERRPAPKGRVARAHHRARARVARLGWHIPAGLPPVAAAKWLRERAGDGAEPLERLAWLHYEVRYGRADDAALAIAAKAIEAELAERLGPAEAA